jgi:hypothetical protein
MDVNLTIGQFPFDAELTRRRWSFGEQTSSRSVNDEVLTMTHMRRSLVLALVLAICSTTTVAAYSGSATDHKTFSGITQYFHLYYNEQVCAPGTPEAGETKYSVGQMKFRYYRSDTTNRFVYNIRWRIGAAGDNCNHGYQGGYVYTNSRPYPTWLTDKHWTGWTVTTVSYPYLGEAGGLSVMGGSVKSRFESRSGAILAEPCSRVNLLGSVVCG